MTNRHSLSPERLDSLDSAIDRAMDVSGALNALARLANHEEQPDMACALSALSDALSDAANSAHKTPPRRGETMTDTERRDLPATITFGDIELRIIDRDGKPWLTAQDVGCALGYAGIAKGGSQTGIPFDRDAGGRQ